jgi:transposase
MWPTTNSTPFWNGTGVYHAQAALAFSDAGATVSIVNPMQVKGFGRRLSIRIQTDGVDSLILALYGAC